MFLFFFFLGFFSGENIGHSIRGTPPLVGITLKSRGMTLKSVVVNEDMIRPVSLMQRPNGCIADAIEGVTSCHGTVHKVLNVLY